MTRLPTTEPSLTYARRVGVLANESVFDPARRAMGELTQQLWDRLGRWATIGKAFVAKVGIRLEHQPATATPIPTNFVRASS